MAFLLSCHNSWKEDFLAHALCKDTSDGSEIFRNLYTAFRGQNFVKSLHEIQLEGSYKIEEKLLLREGFIHRVRAGICWV